MYLDYPNEVKIALKFKFFIHLTKFWIFQGLIQGPLDPKLLTLPLAYEVTSEDRKKKHLQPNQVMAGDSKIQKL